MQPSVYSRIQKTQYSHYGDHTTVCVLTLDNGFSVVGTSGCRGYDPESINEAEELARANALAKLDPLHDFLQREGAR